MRIVVHTNLLVSGVISGGGLPRQLLEAAKTGEFELCASGGIGRAGWRAFAGEFAARLIQAGLTPEGIVGELRCLAVVVSAPATPPRVVPTDPDDGHVIAAAIAATADLIASGDKRNLLRLGSYQGIQIVTARVTIESLSSDAASLKT